MPAHHHLCSSNNALRFDPSWRSRCTWVYLTLERVPTYLGVWRQGSITGLLFSPIAQMLLFKKKRKKSPEPPQPEISTGTADRLAGFRAELGIAPRGGRGFLPESRRRFDVALDEGSSRGSHRSRITFQDMRDEGQGLTAPKASTSHVAVHGTRLGYDHGMSKCSCSLRLVPRL